MSWLILDSSRQNAVRKFSLEHSILLLLFAIVLVPQITHAVGTTTCSTIADFKVEPSPDQFKIPPGGTGTSTLTVTPINGFAGTVALGTFNVPPEITNAILNPTSLNLATGPQTATLTFSASSTPGDYSFDVTAGPSGTLYHTHGIWVKILGPEIGLSADKFTVSLTQGGGSDTATLSLKSLYGFAGDVALTASVHGFGLFHVYTPPTASLSMTPVTLASGATVTSTLTVSASSSATPGLYAIAIDSTSTNPIATNSTRVYVEVHGPDFAIGFKDSTMSLPIGASKTVTLDINSTINFAGPVALTVAIPTFFGTPPTATNAHQTVTLTSGEKFVDSITFTAGASTTAGFYFANVTGTSGGNLAHYALISIEVREAQGFLLTPNPDTITIDRGASASSTISIKSNNLAATINLSISCFPEEITASLSPGSLSLSAGSSTTATLTVSASQYTTPGDYEVAIYGEATTSLAHNETFVTIVVTGPDFSLLATPSSLSIVQGGMQTSTIIATSSNGFTNNVDLLAVPIAPSGLTATLTPATISTSIASTLTINVANTVPTGNYIVIVTGTGGSRQHTATISVEVTAPSSQPDFQISATTPVSFTSGSTTTSTITLSALHGFYAPVALSATVTPPTGLTVSFYPMTSPYGNTPSTATFSSSTPGSYMVTVTGTSGSRLHSTTIRVTVTPTGSPDFDVTSSQTSLSINSGDKETITITVTPKYGFTDNVALTSSVSPSGPTASLSASSVSYGSGSVTLTIDVGSSVTAGTYIVTVQGSSRSLSHSAQLTIIVPSTQSQTSSNPQAILGLAPTMFYALTGGIAIVVIGGIGIAIRLRKPKPL